ncbi:MAG: SRPBCC family protein [bacterium]
MSTKITVQNTISAPLEKVWNYYNTPEHITKWNFADPTWECPKSSVDLRVGGEFSSTMAAKDGSAAFDFAGTYTKLEEFKTIEYSFGDRMANIEFMPTEGGVIVKVTFDPETENPVEMQQGGWQSILDNFKKYVESN